jgi:UDP-glucuronate decarboxylase
MKALVTGGAGFIGFHLAARLVADGNDVILCDDLSRGNLDEDLKRLLEAPNISLVQVNLKDSAAFDLLPTDCDVVYHLAAVNGTRNFYDRPYEVLRTNLLCLMNLLDWLPKVASSKLVWTSSSEVYAGSVTTQGLPIPTGEEVPLTIEDVTNPRFSYAGSKLAGELLCWNDAQTRAADTVIVRPHNIYGPRMGSDHVVSEFIQRINNHEDPFRIFGTNQSRSFCYIDDFVEGLVLAGGTSLNAGPTIINIGNDTETVISDLAQHLFDIANFHPNIDKQPSPPGSVDRRCPDLSKAKELLAYQPRVGLEEGLKKTFDWYSSHQPK